MHAADDVKVIVDVSGKMDVSLIDVGEPPVCIIHGMGDTTIPIQNAIDISDECETDGVVHEDNFVPHAGHAIGAHAPQLVQQLTKKFLLVNLIP